MVRLPVGLDRIAHATSMMPDLISATMILTVSARDPGRERRGSFPGSPVVHRQREAAGDRAISPWPILRLLIAANVASSAGSIDSGGSSGRRSPAARAASRRATCSG